jgi:hypothetical protein
MKADVELLEECKMVMGAGMPDKAVDYVVKRLDAIIERCDSKALKEALKRDKIINRVMSRLILNKEEKRGFILGAKEMFAYLKEGSND